VQARLRRGAEQERGEQADAKRLEERDAGDQGQDREQPDRAQQAARDELELP
jgi:hypothetical protein